MDVSSNRPAVLDLLRCAQAMIVHHSFRPATLAGLTNAAAWYIPKIVPSFSYRGSCFKSRGEGSQIFWIRFGGAVGQGPFKV